MATSASLHRFIEEKHATGLGLFHADDFPEVGPSEEVLPLLLQEVSAGRLRLVVRLTCDEGHNFWAGSHLDFHQSLKDGAVWRCNRCPGHPLQSDPHAEFHFYYGGADSPKGSAALSHASGSAAPTHSLFDADRLLVQYVFNGPVQIATDGSLIQGNTQVPSSTSDGGRSTAQAHGAGSVVKDSTISNGDAIATAGGVVSGVGLNERRLPQESQLSWGQRVKANVERHALWWIGGMVATTFLAGTQFNACSKPSLPDPPSPVQVPPY